MTQSVGKEFRSCRMGQLISSVSMLGLHSFQVPGPGQLSDRISILNLLDRTNLIRPSEGLGIFQSAYGPRFTILNTISLQF